MIELTRELNQKYFEGRNEVTCFTCHRGDVHPTTTVPLGITTDPAETPSSKTDVSIDSILTKYATALGPASARGH